MIKLEDIGVQYVDDYHSLMRNLMFNGFKQIGRGVFASVFCNPEYQDFAVRITRKHTDNFMIYNFIVSQYECMKKYKKMSPKVYD